MGVTEFCSFDVGSWGQMTLYLMPAGLYLRRARLAPRFYLSKILHPVLVRSEDGDAGSPPVLAAGLGCDLETLYRRGGNILLPWR